MQVPVVENRGKRRRRYSPKQRKAGFGGKRSMTTRRTRRRGRSNPALAMLNPTRRKRVRSSVTRRRYRRRSNPFLGGIGNMMNLPTAAGVAGGIVIARIVPGLIQKVWPGVPTTGFPAMGLRLGGILAVGYGVKKVMRQHQLANALVAGGIGFILYQMADEYLLPAIGLSGVGYEDRYITTSELEAMGLSGYRVKTPELSGYQPQDAMIDPVLQG